MMELHRISIVYGGEWIMSATRIYIYKNSQSKIKKISREVTFDELQKEANMHKKQKVHM